MIQLIWTYMKRWDDTYNGISATHLLGNTSVFKLIFLQNNDNAVTLEQTDFGLSISAINKTGGDSTHSRRVGGSLVSDL